MDIERESSQSIQCNRKIPICNILGVEIAAINMEWLLAYLKNNLKHMYGKYICVSNVHTTVMSYENQEYRQVQNDAWLALPDGKPLSVVCKKRGFDAAARVTGPDLMGQIFALSEENGYRHYFYGSTKETLKVLEGKLRENYPKLQIAGMYSPPFRAVSEQEDAEIVKNINETKPDFVWVGLGAPKQEMWMKEHEDKINGLMVGVGAGFDYYAGNIKRAPRWMQSLCLEWLYRLMQEPRRLFKRYITTNFKFVWLIIRGK